MVTLDNNKNRWETVPTYQITAGKAYAFTISPSAGKQSKQYTQITNFLNSIRYTVQYDVYLEISCVKRRVHFHGYIKFPTYSSITTFYNFAGNHLENYTYCIKEIDDHMQWYLYCTKSRHLIEPFCRKAGWEYHIQNTTKTNTLKEQFTKNITSYI